MSELAAELISLNATHVNVSSADGPRFPESVSVRKCSMRLELEERKKRAPFKSFSFVCGIKIRITLVLNDTMCVCVSVYYMS